MDGHYLGPAPTDDIPIVTRVMTGCSRVGERCRRAPQRRAAGVARAREILGGPTLAPEQMVLRETDPARARAIARQHLDLYMKSSNYLDNWKWLGFADEDLAGGGSDRLINSVVAWGDEQAIRARIDAHFAAGADHVCIQPLRADGERGPDLRLLQALAPGTAGGG